MIKEATRIAGGVAMIMTMIVGLQACTSSEDNNSVSTTTQPVVYGDDDRRDYYDHPDAALRELTSNSIVAFFERGDLDRSDPDDIRVVGRTLSQSNGVCSSERFADQVTAADCSATLIDDDLVLTAGHCMSSNSACNNHFFAFNYYMEDSRFLTTMTSDDVYSCAEIIVQRVTGGGFGGGNGEQHDYAIFRLDRPATPHHQPAPVRQNFNPMQPGDEVTVIGFGSGLPAKIDSGGWVIDGRPGILDYFSATTDTFGGNSGSGVFDENNEVIGILVRGDQDYEWNGNCTVVNTLPTSGVGGEGISYAMNAINELCEQGYPSERLCDIDAVCGDGICSSGESTDNCEDDCDGGGGGNVPDTWNCDLDYYGTRDGCDCRCGAIDPDCSISGQEVYNCDNNEICVNDICTEPGGAPGSWTCNPGAWDANDGCDCDCGAWDPDCDDEDARVFGCGSDVTSCNPDGSCPNEGGDTSNGADAGNSNDAGNGDTSDEDTGTNPDDGDSDTCATADARSTLPAMLILGLVVGIRRVGIRRKNR